MFCSAKQLLSSSQEDIRWLVSPAVGADSGGQCDDCLSPPEGSTLLYQPDFDKYTLNKNTLLKSGLKCHKTSGDQVTCSECHRLVYETGLTLGQPFCPANKVGNAHLSCKCPSHAPTWNKHLRRCVSKKDYQPDFDKYVKDSTKKSVKCYQKKHANEILCRECHVTLFKPKDNLESQKKPPS